MKLSRFLTLLSAASVAACATATPVHGPDGDPGWFAITCRRDQGNCVEKAGEVCPGGYVVAGSDGRESLSVIPTQSGSVVSTHYHGEMLVKCKAATVEAAPVAKPLPSFPTLSSGHHELNDVQADCRGTENVEIARLASELATECHQEMRSAAFAVFDLGAKGGFDDVFDAAKAEAALCACRDAGCSPDATAQAARQSSDARDAIGRRMRRGVQELDEPTRGDCRHPETNVELYRLGYQCAASSARRSPLIRKAIEQTYRELFKGPQAAAGLSHAAACFEAFGSAK